MHARPYRETSAIVSLLTVGHGRVAVVGRGVRGGKRGNLLQPFNRVRVSWTGRTGLQTLTGCELTQHGWLQGDALAAGFYVFELVTRLLPEHESVPRVFAGACWALERLETGDQPMDVVLRQFEKLLLDELGYGLDFRHDAETGDPLDPGSRYLLQRDAGFVTAAAGEYGYCGDLLLAIAAGDYGSREVRVAARRIFREALDPLLGPKPLTSRRLLTRTRQR